MHSLAAAGAFRLKTCSSCLGVWTLCVCLSFRWPYRDSQSAVIFRKWLSSPLFNRITHLAAVTDPRGVIASFTICSALSSSADFAGRFGLEFPMVFADVPCTRLAKP